MATFINIFLSSTQMGLEHLKTDSGEAVSSSRIRKLAVWETSVEGFSRLRGWVCTNVWMCMKLARSWSRPSRSGSGDTRVRGSLGHRI